MKTSATTSLILAAVVILAAGAFTTPQAPASPNQTHHRIRIPNVTHLRVQNIARERSITRLQEADTEDRVPRLGKVPFLKRLFGRGKNKAKSETIIQLTPRVVTDSN